MNKTANEKDQIVSGAGRQFGGSVKRLILELSGEENNSKTSKMSCKMLVMTTVP